MSYLSLVKAKNNSDILFALGMYNSTLYHVKVKKGLNPNATEKDH